MVTVFSKEFTDKVPDKVPDNLTENQYRIIELVSGNNTISMSEIANEIGISKRNTHYKAFVI
jgi:DNA-binding MarR family transcriptional regulator